MDDEDLPEAAPAFSAHFTDPVYDDPAGEFAPFGSDQGFDMLYEWAERRDEIDEDTTVADLIEQSGFAEVVNELDAPERPGIPVPGGQVDAATITIGAAFTLLRLTAASTSQDASRLSRHSTSSSAATTLRLSSCANEQTLSLGRDWATR
jgi:sulfur carrier protein ThiS